jgi:hypothetical protein
MFVWPPADNFQGVIVREVYLGVSGKARSHGLFVRRLRAFGSPVNPPQQQPMRRCRPLLHERQHMDFMSVKWIPSARMYVAGASV